MRIALPLAGVFVLLALGGCSAPTVENRDVAAPSPENTYQATPTELELVRKFAEAEVLFSEAKDQSGDQYVAQLVNTAGQIHRGLMSSEATGGLKEAYTLFSEAMDTTNRAAIPLMSGNEPRGMSEIAEGEILMTRASRAFDAYFQAKSGYGWRHFVNDADIKRRAVAAETGVEQRADSEHPTVDDFAGKYQGILRVTDYEPDAFVQGEVVSGTVFFNGPHSAGEEVVISLGGDYQVVGEAGSPAYLGYRSDGYAQVLESIER